MSNGNGIGGTAAWLSGVAVGAAVICWGVLPAMVGLGTQRSPENGDLAKPADLAQWGAANIARMSGAGCWFQQSQWRWQRQTVFAPDLHVAAKPGSTE
jgi:hypothetical protein